MRQPSQRKVENERLTEQIRQVFRASPPGLRQLPRVHAQLRGSTAASIMLPGCCGEQACKPFTNAGTTCRPLIASTAIRSHPICLRGTSARQLLTENG